MKRPLIFLAVFLCLSVPLHSGSMNGELLAQAWDVYITEGPKTLDGSFYFAYVLGVTQGTDMNSTLFDHVPGLSMERMASIVGHYIDKHRNDSDFRARPAVNIVTAAVLETFPLPEIAGHNI